MASPDEQLIMAIFKVIEIDKLNFKMSDLRDELGLQSNAAASMRWLRYKRKLAQKGSENGNTKSEQSTPQKGKRGLKAANGTTKRKRAGIDSDNDVGAFEEATISAPRKTSKQRASKPAVKEESDKEEEDDDMDGGMPEESEFVAKAEGIGEYQGMEEGTGSSSEEA